MGEAATQREVDLWREAVPEAPKGWIPYGGVWECVNGAAYHHPGRQLRVLANTFTEDEHVWLHVSVSCGERLPGYSAIKKIKRDFIGRDRKAIEVHAPSGEHINDHELVRHLWCCLTGDPLPDFRRNGTI